MKQILTRKILALCLLIFLSIAFVFPGTSLAASLPTEKQFTGHVFDQSSDLYYMRARYYDPVIGRFLNPDDQADPAAKGNRYIYTANNPVMLVDPSGNQTIWGGEEIMGFAKKMMIITSLASYVASKFCGDDMGCKFMVDLVGGSSMHGYGSMFGIGMAIDQADLGMGTVATADLLTGGMLRNTTIAALDYRDDPTDPWNAIRLGVGGTLIAAQVVGGGQIAKAGVSKLGTLWGGEYVTTELAEGITVRGSLEWNKHVARSFSRLSTDDPIAYQRILARTREFPVKIWKMPPGNQAKLVNRSVVILPETYNVTVTEGQLSHELGHFARNLPVGVETEALSLWDQLKISYIRGNITLEEMSSLFEEGMATKWWESPSEILFPH